MRFLTIYLVYFCHFIRIHGTISLENRPNIGPILFPFPVLGCNVKESIEWSEGGMGVPPSPQRFFYFQVVNGVILALFLIFFPFLLKK